MIEQLKIAGCWVLALSLLAVIFWNVLVGG